MDLAEVRLWGRRIGAVAQLPDQRSAAFQYDPDFVGSGIELAPLTMPLGRHPNTFPQLAHRTFHGLPGLLADSLPDTFGNALINAWLARQGRSPDDFSPIERLCYVGKRGMGALEYEPSTGPQATDARALEVQALVDLASRILNHRRHLDLSLAPGQDEEALTQLLRVGTSAGGARAKALVAWNPDTNEVRSGQVDPGTGFEHWILKFDGISGRDDQRFGNPLGYGFIEYAYYLMAREAGIAISDCQLFAESGRHHFMTRRFDRTAEGKKVHMLSLGAIAHFDYNDAGAYGYEQALLVIRRLGLPMAAVEEQFRRMVFNILARNQDDHVKNIAFLMDKRGSWSLSPAFDLTYAYNPSGDWTARHQMTVNGKDDEFTQTDLESVARVAAMKRGRHAAIYREVLTAVSRWMKFAEEAGVAENVARRVQKALRLGLQPD